MVGSRLFGSIGLVLFTGYAISRGAQALAGEEGEGTLELLVTQPISRTRIATAKLVATWLGLAALVLVQQAALLAVSPGVGLDFGIGLVAAASLGLYLLAAVFGMLAYATGAVTGSRGTAVAVAGAAAAGLFLLAGLGQRSRPWRTWRGGARSPGTTGRWSSSRGWTCPPRRWWPPSRWGWR